MILGKIDDVYACIDSRCDSTCMDIIDEDGLRWLVECAFCGTGQRVPAIRGHLKPQPTEFRFADGRFEGLTPAEAAQQPNGMIYLRWAAEHHKRPAVRDACKRHIDAQAAAH